jgi:hypothetical protein
MPRCEYVGPSGNQCTENADEGKTICFWHDREADKSGDDIKERLEKKARANLQDGSLFGINLTGANLMKANLRDANMRESKLEGADLLGASPKGRGSGQGEMG